MRRAALVGVFAAVASCATHRPVAIVRPSAPAVTEPLSTRSPSPAPPTMAPSVPPTPAHSALVVDRLHGLGSATQAIVVTSSSWNTDVATLQAFEMVGGSWRTFTTATTAFVGVNGFASDKHEGDGRTPAGVYGFSMMFGTSPDPGVRFAYRHAGTGDVWVDDPSSSLYNTWQTDPPNGRWSSAERLYQPGAYRYAAVIAYNTSRTRGRGSAIFLHVSLGHGTAGCVAVDEAVLVRLLRWLDPARRPLIVMGPQSYVEGG